VPEGPPNIRHTDKRGYTMLKWKTGRNTYVWCYEHQLVAGMPHGLSVHHKDGNKSNNSPDNLETVDQTSHMLIHAREWRHWNVEEAIKLRESGWTYNRIGDWAGVHYVTVLRGIRNHKRRLSEATL
jgi:hypothetical protein